MPRSGGYNRGSGERRIANKHMLVELLVENFAVVERARVRFHAGLNLLTGETGSGKSLVVDALGLLFGGRASSEVVRTGAERARITGIFEAPVASGAKKVLADAGIETEDGELLVQREILSNGKSRAFVGSRTVTASLLREVSLYLGDIHGQHDQQQLFSPGAQREMLDSFASCESLIGEIGVIFSQWRARNAELEDFDRNEQEKLRLVDLWSFQKKEIEAVAPKPGEDAALENERGVLRNVSRLQENAAAAHVALYDASESAAAQLRVAMRKIEELAKYDTSQRETVEALKPALIAIEEAGQSMAEYADKLEADPARLEEVESRLESVDKLKRKYGATIDDILQFLNEARTQLEAVENSTERRAALEKDRKRLAAEYEASAAKLSTKRLEGAGQLAKKVETELASLAMQRSQFTIRISASGWTAEGVDEVAFLISPNPGEEPKPLEKIASGGELSRVALAVKTCTQRAAKGIMKTLVFDEVDAGVGGSAAESVGRRLKKLAAANQVLCVTHLAQIAGFADHHYYVEKHDSRGRTVATIAEIEGEARTREIGRMLSGERVTAEAIQHAAQLIKLGAKP